MPTTVPGEWGCRLGDCMPELPKVHIRVVREHAARLTSDQALADFLARAAAGNAWDRLLARLKGRLPPHLAPLNLPAGRFLECESEDSRGSSGTMRGGLMASAGRFPFSGMPAHPEIAATAPAVGGASLGSDLAVGTASRSGRTLCLDELVPAYHLDLSAADAVVRDWDESCVMRAVLRSRPEPRCLMPASAMALAMVPDLVDQHVRRWTLYTDGSHDGGWHGYGVVILAETVSGLSYYGILSGPSPPGSSSARSVRSSRTTSRSTTRASRPC